MTDFYIKQDDTSPSLAATLKDSDGNAVDLTGATVRFHMTERPSEGKTAKVDAAANVDTAASGEVSYDWQSGDTDTVGLYNAEWEVTYSSGKIETFPADGYTVIEVTDDLA